MQALLLAGGYGTRLKPFTLDLPKPMLPFVNRPILEHAIRLLKNHNLTDINLLLHYHPEKITSYFKEGKEIDVSIRYNTALEDYGTAGSVRLIGDKLKSTFLVMNGDVLTDVDITNLLKFHKKKGGIATIVLAKVRNPLPFGIANVDENFRIKQFVEKPSQSELISDLVNAGIYILEREILEHIPIDQPYLFALDLFPTLLKKGMPIYGFVHTGYWQDIGDIRQYLLSHYDYLKGKFFLPDYSHNLDETNKGNKISIDNNVEFEGTNILGDNCSISSGSRIVRSVLGNNVEIGPGVEISDSIIWSNVKIGAGTRIISDVIANHSTIGEHVYFEDNVFISDHCEIGDLSVLKSNVKIWPGKKIESSSVVTSSLVWGDRWLRDLFVGSKIVGVVNREVSPEFGAKLGAAFGAFLGQDGTVLVSWDGAPASRMINRAIICGLMSAGVNVGDLRVMPVPILRYALQTGAQKGGVHVCLSREKENVVEILFLQNDGQYLSAQQARSVERLFIQEDFSRAAYQEIGQLDFPVRVVESYQEQYLKNLAIKQIENAKFKIVVDYSFGPASLILPTILGLLDCEVISLNAYLDTKHTLKRWNDFRYALLQLGNIVVSLKADAGFLIDVSTERIFVVDENGHYLKNEYLLTLVTKLFLKIFRHSFIGMPASSPMILQKLAESYGTQIIQTQMDLRSISNTIQKKQISYIGDGEGRFIFPEFHFASDGMFAMGKILELLALNEIRLKDLQKTVPPPIMDKKQISCPRDSIGTILRELVDSSTENVESTFDGIKFYFPDGWLLVTPSQQKPALILIAEGINREKVNHILDQYSKRIENIKLTIRETL